MLVAAFRVPGSVSDMMGDKAGTGRKIPSRDPYLFLTRKRIGSDTAAAPSKARKGRGIISDRPHLNP